MAFVEQQTAMARDGVQERVMLRIICARQGPPNHVDDAPPGRGGHADGGGVGCGIAKRRGRVHASVSAIASWIGGVPQWLMHVPVSLQRDAAL